MQNLVLLFSLLLRILVTNTLCTRYLCIQDVLRQASTVYAYMEKPLNSYWSKIISSGLYFKYNNALLFILLQKHKILDRVYDIHYLRKVDNF